MVCLDGIPPYSFGHPVMEKQPPCAWPRMSYEARLRPGPQPPKPPIHW